MGSYLERAIASMRSVLREIGANNLDLGTVIDRARVANEREDAEKAEYERVEAFEAQINRLVDRGAPDHADINEDTFRGWFAPLRRTFQVGDVIVVPERLIPLARQVSMILYNVSAAENLVDPTQVYDADGVGIPQNPYLLRDIEDGTKMLKTSPDDCVKQFARESRKGLTAIEGVNLVVHRPEILNDHYIDLPGSRLAIGTFVPGLWVGDDGVTKLGWRMAGHAVSGWGSASAGSRLS